MNQLMCISRSGLRVFFIEKAAFEATEQWYTHSGLATFSKVEPCDSIFIDGGGAIFQDEPTVDISVNAHGVEINVSTYKRHIPFVVAALEEANEKKIPGCVMIGGQMGLYVFTVETRDMLVGVLKGLEGTFREEIKNLEAKMYEGLTSAGVLSLGKCSCQSGLPYGSCCGAQNQNSIME